MADTPILVQGQEPQNVANVAAPNALAPTTTSTLPSTLTPAISAPTTTSTLPDEIPLPPGASLTAAANVAAPTTIRNISQTAQEREIIKTAPDLLVYFEGLPFLVNYFIQDPNTRNPYTIVPFNSFVTTFNTGYDTDSLVPSASIQLTVPNFLRHLFQMPGGNNLIQTMMQVQVFAKGYYFGNDGSTLFRRVFKGITSHIAYSDDGKMLQIQVQCHGTLHLMELMQVDLAPPVISNSPREVTALKTQMAFCNPYLMILHMFIRAISTEGFYVNSVTGGTIATDYFEQSVKQGFVSKWQQILGGLQKDVHIYGLTDKDNPTTEGQTKASSAKHQVDKNISGVAQAYFPEEGDPDMKKRLALIFPKDGTNSYPAIQQYLPDMGISSIQLLNSKIINRLDEIRTIQRLILFEGYQDVDGKIIFKPPLYNLDVTNIGDETDTIPSANAGGITGVTTLNPSSGLIANNSAALGGPLPSAPKIASNPITEINPTNNPFIINLAEIITEQETEDQAAIKTTRMTVQGNWEPTFQFEGNQQLLETVEFIDIPKLQKFGLREEPTRPVGWFKDGDRFGLWAYAAAETARANRGYRTYTVTIPMRPELKLGFPCFIPHRDIYGYIKSIQLQYQQGAQATMTVTMDTLRRRFLLPTTHTDPQGKQVQIFTSRPNLVWHWTTAETPTQGQAPGTTATYVDPQQTQLSRGSDAATNAATDNSSLTNLIGSFASLPTTPDQQPSPQQQVAIALRQQQIGNSWSTEPDNSGASFRIQQDTYKSWVPPPKGSKNKTGTYPKEKSTEGGVFWRKGNTGFSRIVDQTYYQDVRRTMPFTDDKGYELVTPFPWGRWISLRHAFKEFTQDGYITPKTASQVTADEFLPANSVQALLVAGLATPNFSGNTVTQLEQAMIQNQHGSAANPQEAVGDYTIIVLSYSGTSPSDSKLATTAQPDVDAAIQQLQGTLTTQKQAIDVLVSGDISPTKATMEALASKQSAVPTTNIGLTPAQSSPPKNIFPRTASGWDGIK